MDKSLDTDDDTDYDDTNLLFDSSVLESLEQITLELKQQELQEQQQQQDGNSNSNNNYEPYDYNYNNDDSDDEYSAESDEDGGEMELFAMMDSLVVELQTELDLMGNEQQGNNDGDGEDGDSNEPYPYIPNVATNEHDTDASSLLLNDEAQVRDADHVSVLDYTNTHNKNEVLSPTAEQYTPKETRIQQRVQTLVQHIRGLTVQHYSSKNNQGHQNNTEEELLRQDEVLDFQQQQQPLQHSKESLQVEQQATSTNTNTTTTTTLAQGQVHPQPSRSSPQYLDPVATAAQGDDDPTTPTKPIPSNTTNKNEDVAVQDAPPPSASSPYQQQHPAKQRMNRLFGAVVDYTARRERSASQDWDVNEDEKQQQDQSQGQTTQAPTSVVTNDTASNSKSNDEHAAQNAKDQNQKPNPKQPMVTAFGTATDQAKKAMANFTQRRRKEYLLRKQRQIAEQQQQEQDDDDNNDDDDNDANNGEGEEETSRLVADEQGQGQEQEDTDAQPSFDDEPISISEIIQQEHDEEALKELLLHQVAQTQDANSPLDANDEPAVKLQGTSSRRLSQKKQMQMRRPNNKKLKGKNKKKKRQHSRFLANNNPYYRNQPQDHRSQGHDMESHHHHESGDQYPYSPHNNNSHPNDARAHPPRNNDRGNANSNGNKRQMMTEDDMQRLLETLMYLEQSLTYRDPQQLARIRQALAAAEGMPLR